MASTEKITIRGLREVQLSMARYERAVGRTAAKAAYLAAKLVALDARPRFVAISQKTATGFVPNVRGTSARVRQRLSKTTGLRGDFGSLQMRMALLPALESKQSEAVSLYEVQFELLRRGNGL